MNDSFLLSFCVSVPVKRWVVKLRMKVQDSSVDLNDPAVKANILKKASLQNPPLKCYKQFQGDICGSKCAGVERDFYAPTETSVVQNRKQP